MGLLTVLPPVFIIIAHRNGLRHVPHRFSMREWRYSLLLRIFSAFMVITGGRLLEVNMTRANKPYVFEGTFDELTQVAAAVLGVAVSVFLLFLYLLDRPWDDS